MQAYVEELLSYVERARKSDVPMVVVTGSPGSGKSYVLRSVADLKKWKYVDCRTLIAEELIELLPNMRAEKAPAIMSEILDKYEAEAFLLDRVQTFFTPVLKLNPLELLRKLSKKHLLIVAWPGYFEDGSLYFVRPDEQEPLKFDARDIIVWSVDKYKEEIQSC